ncbi:hypothetical protein [Sphingomonas abietis]|uniref:Uncharacterized protein n=1 Tax=Sphingomonas abietis TaxID=3012344 RepID=A0ABY7NLV6_9SPHN|nr:hypothetical protein [Sphingomonas abietis]WBO22217.1 hypothetical protein PBT88_19035 [Sphingomonas abietis]
MAHEAAAQLNAIGNLLAMDTQYPLDGTFLYVEADWGWADISIFKDLGASLLWRDPMDGLFEALLDLREAEASDKRWSTMQYRITGDRFDAAFTYEPLDSEESTIDRRAIILRQRYGNKQVVYPPLP